ncbi:YNR044Wp-like protein, partial [Saccharomyces cerevisiae AWRI1631]
YVETPLPFYYANSSSASNEPSSYSKTFSISSSELPKTSGQDVASTVTTTVNGITTVYTKTNPERSTVTSTLSCSTCSNMPNDASGTTNSMPSSTPGASSDTQSKGEVAGMTSSSLSGSGNTPSAPIVVSTTDYPAASPVSPESQIASSLKSNLSSGPAFVSSTTPTAAPTTQTENGNSGSKSMSTEGSKSTSTLLQISSLTEPELISATSYSSTSPTFGSSIVISTYAGSAARPYLNHAISLIMALPLAFL